MVSSGAGDIIPAGITNRDHIRAGEITVKINLLSFPGRDSRVRFRDTDKPIRLPYSEQNKWQYIAVVRRDLFVRFP